MVTLSMERLCSKDNESAFAYFEELEMMSQTSQDIYHYFDDFIQMLEDKRSFVRIRAFRLIAVNAKWDSENKLDLMIDDYLKHIEDDKAFVCRQCIPYLNYVASAKPHFIHMILHALVYFDIERYKESMQSLLQGDIDQTIHYILENAQISYCGLMCHVCPIKIVTMTNDDTLKERLAKEYTTSDSLFVKADMTCSGCQQSIGINQKMCLDCPMRQCALQKNITHCGECQNYPCDTVDKLLSRETQQRQILDVLFQYKKRRHYDA